MYYIITDPCYLISNENWNKIFNPLDLKDPDFFPKAIKGITDELNKIGNCLGVAETGEGDWQNSISWSADYVKHIENEFFSDAGLVCAMEFYGDISEYKKLGAAIVESEIPLTCHMDQSNPNWTVVKLFDDHNRLALETESASSNGYGWDEEDEECGWGYYDDEDED